jgi:hypothetical protein
MSIPSDHPPDETMLPTPSAEPDRLVEEGDRAHEQALRRMRADVRFADVVAALQAYGASEVELDPFFYRVHSPARPRSG